MMPVACLFAVLVMQSPRSTTTFETNDGFTYPQHTSSSGRADTVPIESKDVTYPDVRASFVKSGPPGPGVEIESDRNVYGQERDGADSDGR